MSLISAQMARKYMADREVVEDKAVTVRPASTAVFAMDSEDRYKTYAERRLTPSYPFSINISKNQSLLNGFFTRLAVSEFRMYWTLPNISAAWGNNTLTYWESTTSAQHTITIPDGFYDLESLMAVIQDEVRGDGFLPNFIAQAGTDGTTTYSAGAGKTFYWVRPLTNVKTLYDMLNLITYLPPLVPNQASYRGGVANLRSTDYIDIVSPQLTYNQALKDGTSAIYVRDILARIYLDDTTKSLGRFNTNVFDVSGNPAGFQAPQYDPTTFTNGCNPFTIYRQWTQPKQVQWNDAQPLGNVTFELYDDQGRSIQDLWNAEYPVGDPTQEGGFYANSFMWNMTLLVTEN